jgi:hypothetical protein
MGLAVSCASPLVVSVTVPQPLRRVIGGFPARRVSEHPPIELPHLRLDAQRQRASGGERCCTRLARSTVNFGYSVD